MHAELSAKWQAYPVGPAIRKLFNIDDDLATKHWDEDSVKDFEEDLYPYFNSYQIDSMEVFVDLMEELTLMKMTGLAVWLHEKYPFLPVETDFRALLFLGSAYMIEGKSEQAISFFELAYDLVPEESAPAINLTKLHFQNGAMEEALAWAKKALRFSPNHYEVWQIVGYASMDGLISPEDVGKLAELYRSYVGMSLYSYLVAEQDPAFKANLYYNLYNEGERSEEFLIEYTAALALAERFQEIPAVVHDASQRNITSWKLSIHAAQAFLALNERDQFAFFATKAKDEGAPAEVLYQLENDAH
jgi:tetratricopeptide (TPR) repeat protein